jgi:hypothetical protein
VILFALGPSLEGALPFSLWEPLMISSSKVGKKKEFYILVLRVQSAHFLLRLSYLHDGPFKETHYKLRKKLCVHLSLTN